jgi:hypothetical protein
MNIMITTAVSVSYEPYMPEIMLFTHYTMRANEQFILNNISICAVDLTSQDNSKPFK